MKKSMSDSLKRKLKQYHKNSEKKAYLIRSFYELRSILGYSWAIFYILLGGRDAGKSYGVAQLYVDQFVNKGRPFYWMRLTDKSASALLKNNAEKLIDHDIRRRYNLDLVTLDNKVYHVTRRSQPDKDGKTRILEKKLMCTVVALSNFYNDKGSAYFDKDFLNDPNQYYNICFDEINREIGEKNTFDICYSFVNQMENLVRDTKNRVRVIMIGNTLQEASDILCLFNFIPETFGRFKLRKKRAIIEYMPLTEQYQERRKGTIADLLMPNESTFSNKISTDNTLITKRRLVKPSYIIKFTKSQDNWYTVWDDNVICKFNNEKCQRVYSMRPFIDTDYRVEDMRLIFDWFHQRCFMFRNLITFKTFQKELSILKPKG